MDSDVSEVQTFRAPFETGRPVAGSTCAYFVSDVPPLKSVNCTGASGFAVYWPICAYVRPLLDPRAWMRM